MTAIQPCSDEVIAQIEAALAKATVAPWSEGGTFMPNTEHERVSVWGPTPVGFQSGVWVIKDAGPSDAALIVLLRNNAEALLASVQTHKARAEAAVEDEVLISTVLALSPGELKADMLRSLPGGVMDDATYEQVEEALDQAEAPSTRGGRWLKLNERIVNLGSAARLLKARAEEAERERDEFRSALATMTSRQHPSKNGDEDAHV